MYCNLTDAQSCVDTVNVQQQGSNRLSSNLYVIVPRSNFSCNGRIVGYQASLYQNDDEFDECNFPYILLWRPTNAEQTTYNIEDSYTLRSRDIDRMGSYYFADVSFTGGDRIEFQSGDVIGYRHRSSPCYTVYNINTGGYTSYSVRSISNDVINIGDSSVAETDNRQPLIQVIFGMHGMATYNAFTTYVCCLDIRCDDLSAPANGVIMSCSSGTVGVGYEGDACSFTCNTGYELTGSDTRTCQSNGSWSGSDVTCNRGIYIRSYVASF